MHGLVEISSAQLKGRGMKIRLALFLLVALLALDTHARQAFAKSQADGTRYMLDCVA